MMPGCLYLRGRGPCRQVLPVHTIRRASVTRAMRPDLIIEGQVARHALLGVVDGLVGMKIDLLILEAPPQPFNKDVVSPPSGPSHANLNPMSLQKPGEFLAGELTTLIRVEDLRRAIPGDDLLHRVHTKIRGQRIWRAATLTPGDLPRRGSRRDRRSPVSSEHT